MDPLADKLLVCSAMICLVDLKLIPVWVVLINLEDTNADLIRQEVPKIERLKILREKAYRQLELLRKNQDTIEALKKNLIEDTETNG